MAEQVTFAPAANGRTDVLVDGQVVGQVFRKDFQEFTVKGDGKQNGTGVGRMVTRKARWAWETEDGMGDDDFPSRKAAVADLLCFV